MIMKKMLLLVLMVLPLYCDNVVGQSFWKKLGNAVVKSVVKSKTTERQAQNLTTYQNSNVQNISSFKTGESNQMSSVSNVSDDDVTLVVSGDGRTKDEATKAALRSAIEQVYGAFVSANTSIVNDELTKDEIVTVATGNVKSYTELSYNNIDGVSFVTIKATVSRNKLVSYAKSKGASTEFAGSTFGMNMKLKELNRKNEITVLNNLLDIIIISLPNCYDLNATVGDIKVTNERQIWNDSDPAYDVPVKVSFIPNSNAEVLNKAFWDTWNGIVMSQEEQAEYENLNMGVAKYRLNGSYYYLRNGYDVKRIFVSLLTKAAVCELFNFEIKDNLGNKVSFFPEFNFDDNPILKTCFNIYSSGAAVIEPWNYGSDKFDWDYRFNDEIGEIARTVYQHYQNDLWVGWYYQHALIFDINNINFNKAFTIDVTLKILQSEISKYSRFDVERITDDLYSLMQKASNEKRE